MMDATPIYRHGVIIGYSYADSTPLKRRYRLGQFLRVLTDDEYAQVEALSIANTPAGKRAKRLLAIWREAGVDFNDPLTYSAITAAFGATRAGELAG